MSEEANTPSEPTPEERLAKALADFQEKADEVIKEVSKHKAELIDGGEGQPSVVKQLTDARDGARKLAEEIGEFHASLNDPAKNDGKAVVVEVPEFLSAIRDAKSRVEKLEADIKAYEESLLGKKEGDKEIPGIKQEVEGKVNQIIELHSKVYDKRGDQASVAQAINEFITELTQKKNEFETIKKEVEGYEDTLFGPKNEEGQRKDGIKGQVEGYLKELSDLVTNSTATQSRLRKKSEEMLQDAATASLAEDSIKQKKSFVWLNALWAIALFVAIGMLIKAPSMDFSGGLAKQMVAPVEHAQVQLVADSTVAQLPTVSTQPNAEAMTHATPALPWYVLWLMRLPFVGGAIWLGWYAGKQLSQNKRLRQEYAHKENVAKLYYSLKREIEELEKDGDDARLARILKVRVMRVLVNSMGHNPSTTLDSKSHDDNGPMQKSYDKAFDSVKGIAEAIAKIKVK